MATTLEKHHTPVGSSRSLTSSEALLVCFELLPDIFLLSLALLPAIFLLNLALLPVTFLLSLDANSLGIGGQ